MDYRIKPAKKFKGRWRAAGDKSITHRALLFNALADGEAVVRNANGGEDCARTRTILGQLGIAIEPMEKHAWRIVGGGGRLDAPGETLDAGNSGTTMRLLAGALAGRPFAAVIDGDETLRRRPMERIRLPLAALGAELGTEAGGLPPLRAGGGELRAGSYESPVASAQVKSAFLLAAMRAEGESSFREPSPSRDHTERLLARMGVEIARDGDGWLRIAGPQLPSAVDVAVPGDISSAIFLLAAGLVVEGGSVLVKRVGVNPTRSGCLRVLERMGARFALYHPSEEGGEPVADLLAQHSLLGPALVKAEEVPSLVDEIPVLAALAARADGESRFEGLAELRVKESDRLAGTAAVLSAFGATARVDGDALVVNGGDSLKGCDFDAGGDHRLAMAAAVLGFVSRGETVVRGAECVATSFPEFASLCRRFSDGALRQVTGAGA